MVAFQQALGLGPLNDTLHACLTFPLLEALRTFSRYEGAKASFSSYEQTVPGPRTNM